MRVFEETPQTHRWHFLPTTCSRHWHSPEGPLHMVVSDPPMSHWHPASQGTAGLLQNSVHARSFPSREDSSDVLSPEMAAFFICLTLYQAGMSQTKMACPLKGLSLISRCVTIGRQVGCTVVLRKMSPGLHMVK